MLDENSASTTKGNPHMTLAETLLRQLDDPTLTRDEQAMLRCRITADFEHRGQYEAAGNALAELWQGIGQRPILKGLPEGTAAEVLLRAGSLSGWLASAAQDKEGQAAAKDLISESITRFESLGETARAAAAQSDLGYCYWREGAYDEARVIYANALKKLTDKDDRELRAKILIRCVLVESCSGRYNDSLRLLTDATQLFEESTSNALKGKFHNELGLVLRKLGTVECRPDYTDRAIIEYTAASHHFELAGHTRYRASAENNLGFLLYLVGRYEEAHEHLNRARVLFLGAKDKGRIAQVDDARARVLLAEGRIREAGRAIRDAVRTLEKGGEQALLAEALTTQGRVLSKSGDFAESRNTLRRAANLAEQAGAVEDAGRSLLTLIEEHGERITEHELLETYRRAENSLKATQDAGTIARLRDCAGRIVSARLTAAPAQQGRSFTDVWANFNLSKAVHEFEARFIRRALIDAQGSITRAARLLGFTHHGTLASMLEGEGRHKDLSHLRTPPGRRRRSIVRGSITRRRRAKTRPARILHAEDYEMVAVAVKDALEEEGWMVETCADGMLARELLTGDAPYDILIFDYDLPGQNGVELTRYARILPHRRRTPIIMLTASEIEPEAWRAGVDAFLRKPNGIGQLATMVARLLTADK
ncbi:MAG: tetratricopeptide repeat protein [Acidobacteria bacterium]|nr:tetratricopeptide repeat protein [Acidobacteriota bacterium]